MAARLRLRSDERGIALVMALGFLVVLTILVTSLISYTTATTHATSSSGKKLDATQYAEAGLNYAYGILAQQISSGGNPIAANLLGCAGATGPSDTNAPSNCSTPTPKIFCMRGGSCTAGSPQTVSLYGYFSGTNAQTFAGFSVPASTWLLVATGYSSNPGTGGVTPHTMYASVTANGQTSGAVGAMWNHVFLTAPLVANQCQTDFSSNNLVIDVPLYVIGNLCFSGNNNIVKEIGQPVDLQVGGKLVINGNNGNAVGVSASVPITSGVVVGGCTNGAVTSSTTPCASPAYRYWVTTTDTFSAQSAPSQTTADIQKDYTSFDPGPKHPCQAGTNPAPLASTVFDNNTTYNNSAASFELAPASSYSCISQNGSSVGQLTWDSTAKKLTINGSVFFDGSLTISQSVYYVGTGIIEVAGTVKINGLNTTVCATSPCNTALNAWQGTSGNNSMLTLAPLASGTSMTLTNNNQTFQGSIWTQPTATLSFAGNNDTVEGPLSIGTLDTPSNNAALKPLPAIKNMPLGAPLPPNVGVTISPLSYVRS
jgi:Tfp pilus assembly protein PilX